MSVTHADHEFAQLTMPSPSTDRREVPKSRIAVIDRPRCAGMGKDGEPCRGTPGSDNYCLQHTKRFSDEERLAWRKRGNNVQAARRVQAELATAVTALDASNPAPDFSTPAGVRKCLEETVQKVTQHRLAPSQATAISNLATLAIRLGELELESRLLDAELADAQADRAGR